jgi:rod shape-determining protein MreC
MLYPFLRLQQFIIEPIVHWRGHSVTMQDLQNKVSCLQREREVLFAENIALQSMQHYADATNELREFNTRYLLKKGHVVHVMARHFSVNNQFFLVDAGARQGITKDMVALYGNCIVGRVAQVYPWYSKVSLITDIECKVAAFCPKAGISGIHEGTNSSEYTALCYVSHLKKVHSDSIILSSGEGLVFPYGFAIGKIVSVLRGELFYDIVVKPAVDFNALEYCTLVAKEDIGNISLRLKG